MKDDSWHDTSHGVHRVDRPHRYRRCNQSKVEISSNSNDKLLYRGESQERKQKKDLELLANRPLSVTVAMTPPDKRLHDIDNILKCLFDSLTHACFWQDDSYVKELHMSYASPKKQGSVLASVEVQ